MSRDMVQNHVNITITQKHPQLVPFAKPAGKPAVSMETLLKKLRLSFLQLFHFQVQTKRPSNKMSCLFNLLSATTGQ